MLVRERGAHPKYMRGLQRMPKQKQKHLKQAHRTPSH